MIGRGHHPGGQFLLDPLHQDAQVSLDARVLVQQVRQPRRPLRRQHGTRLLQIRALHSGQLLAGLLQPSLRQLFLLGVAAAEQPGDPALGRLPRVGRCCLHHRLPGQRRQRHQALCQHLRPPLADL